MCSASLVRELQDKRDVEDLTDTGLSSNLNSFLNQYAFNYRICVIKIKFQLDKRLTSGTAHIKTAPSALPVTMNFPHGLYAQETITPACPYPIDTGMPFW